MRSVSGDEVTDLALEVNGGHTGARRVCVCVLGGGLVSHYKKASLPAVLALNIITHFCTFIYR